MNLETLTAALDPELLEAIAAELVRFEDSARAHSLRVMAGRQRKALACLPAGRKATRFQINIIANRANTYGDGGERHAAKETGVALFPESESEIQRAIIDHPINVRWDEYRVSTGAAREAFLLPEK